MYYFRFIGKKVSGQTATRPQQLLSLLVR